MVLTMLYVWTQKAEHRGGPNHPVSRTVTKRPGSGCELRLLPPQEPVTCIGCTCHYGLQEPRRNAGCGDFPGMGAVPEGGGSRAGPSLSHCWPREDPSRCQFFQQAWPVAFSGSQRWWCAYFKTGRTPGANHLQAHSPQTWAPLTPE
jgi:hypothetical protein